MTSYLRPDEQVTESEIRNTKRRNQDVSSVANALPIAGAGLAKTAISKVMPFINQYIPKELALKGINKVMPSMGKFLQAGIKNGLSLESGLNYLKDEFSREQSAKESKNIIEQESPELHQFISEEIKKGRKPIEAGAIAQNDKRFKDVINKLSKNHKTNWSSILESIYGSGEMAQPQSQQLGNAEQLQQQSQQGQQQQQGQMNQGIQAALDKIMKM